MTLVFTVLVLALLAVAVILNLVSDRVAHGKGIGDACGWAAAFLFVLAGLVH